MKKLLLINPVGRKSGYMLSPFTMFPPLGLAYVAAATPPDWDVRILDENFDEFHFEPADLVGITALTSNVNRAYEIGKLYLERNVKVIMGGIHPSMAPDEAMGHADAVVVGEAETIWREVLQDFENNRLRRRYDGPRIDLKNKPLRPRRDLIHPGYLWDSIQTSRGCPFNCSFCSVSKYLGREYRKRQAVDVMAELKGLKKRWLLFLDDNLIGYSSEDRETSAELFRAMIESGLNKKWMMQTSINAAADDHILDLAAKAGCILAFVGFETTDETNLRSMNKGVNLKTGVQQYRQVVTKFHKYGIGVIGSFIIGNDYESTEYYKKLSKFMLRSGIDSFQISILTPLPGTPLMEQLQQEGRIVCSNFPSDWDKFRMSYVVHLPNGTSAESIYAGNNFLKGRLYTFPRYQIRLLRSFLSLKGRYSFYSLYKMNQALKRSWMNSHYFDPKTSPPR
jgi:radical SAM superfamily enzyme YgiQ (UPF0313 family)